MIIACSHGVHIGKRIARRLGEKYSFLTVDHFPDSETYLRFRVPVRGKNVVLVQSFYDNVNDCLTEVIFAAATARSLGAKKITLVAPHFPYFRQDKRFKSGECVSIDVVSKLVTHYFDEFYVVDPHLHRRTAISRVFGIPAHALTANGLVAHYIKKNIRNPVLIGPDVESYKWAELTAKLIKSEYSILRKLRHSSRKVDVSMTTPIDLRNKTAVIVDDIISTGHTLLETIKQLKKLGAKKIVCICVHGIFAENALSRLKKTGATIISTNTLPNPAAKIDVAGLIAEQL